ncbi:hypothetical protein D9M72_462820 [compost metagenome]
MLRRFPEADGDEQRFELARLVLRGAELHEGHSLDVDARGHLRNRQADVRLGALHLVPEIDQRAVAVDRDGIGVTAAKLVVEDFKRQISIIAGRRHRAGKVGHRQVALARHIAKVPAPIEQIHVDQRSIRKLDDEDFLLRDRADRIDLDLARQGMKAVENEAYARVIGAPDDLPGIAMVADMAPPGERLVTDAQVPLRRPLAEFAKVGGCPVDASHCRRRHVRADEHQVGAQLLHQVELALGPVESPGSEWLRHTLEITERLEQTDLQAKVAHHSADLARAFVEGKEVVLEYFDTGKARLGDGAQLVLEIAAQRNRCYRGLHASFLAGVFGVSRSSS